MGSALVTGVSGSVGGVLAGRLQDAGLDVRVLVRTAEQAKDARGWVESRRIGATALYADCGQAGA